MFQVKKDLIDRGLLGNNFGPKPLISHPEDGMAADARCLLMPARLLLFVVAGVVFPSEMSMLRNETQVT